MRASIIIASHNEGELLANTIESCIETTAGMDYEIIVADDASTDGSAEAAARRFPMVRLYRHGKRQGASPTKHLGSRQARGEVFLFLDGHSKPEYDSLLRLVRGVEETEGQAVITPRILALDAGSWKNIATQTGHGYAFDLRTIESRWVPLHELKKSSLGRGQFYESPALIGCGFAVSRLVYEKVWGFDPKMKFWGVEDLDFSLKCWLMGHPILHDPETGVGHRFQESFDRYSVPMEHIVVNELRLAYKNFTQAVWGAWLADGRVRHSGALSENPEGLWAHAWELFKSEEDSARQERSYLQARRQRDEFWYAEKFGLSWPRLMSTGRVFAAGASPSPSPSGGPSPSAKPSGAPSPSPSPAPAALQIVDLKAGTVVSGTTITKIVGQKIQLQVKSQPAGTLSKIQWTIPGQRIKNYTQSLTAGTQTALAAGDLQTATAAFYWIAAGSFAVKVTATVNGKSLTASVTCKVLAPTNLSMTSVTGAVAVGNPGFGGGVELHFGTNTTPGITWSFKATAPAGGAGLIAGTQLLNIVRTKTPNAAAIQTLTSAGTFVLDTNVPYNGQSTAIASGAAATATNNDTPGSPVAPGFSKVTANDHFQLFFMYKPDGADSIWVTIGLLQWNWAGQTVRGASPTSWGAPTGVSNSTNPSGAASSALPVWTKNFTSLTFA